MGAAAIEIEQLRGHEAEGRYPELIAGLRELVAADPRMLSDDWIAGWCGRRWRNLFVAEAADDEDAVEAAGQRLTLPGTDLSIPSPTSDERSDRQRVAERFLVDAGEEWRVDMPPAPTAEGTTLVFCPGLIGTMLPLRGFEKTFPGLASELGWPIIAADAHPMRSCEANVADLAATLERGAGLGPELERIEGGEGEGPERAILLGYSKGAPDALTLLVERPDLANGVEAVVGWAGAFGGSYLADDIYEQVRGLSFPEGRLGEGIKALIETVFPIVRLEGISERLEEYDVAGAIRDLTTERRERWLEEHRERLDSLAVPIFTLSGATRATEVPFFQVQGYMELAKHDRDNDMQLTQQQARLELPMSVHLGTVRAHHWDMAYDPFPLRARLGSPNLDHRFPRRAALGATMGLLAELGLAS